MAFAFGLSAEIERNLIASRTTESLARLKAEGKILGRPKGSKSKTTKLAGKEEIIKNLLQQKLFKTEIAKLLDVDESTLYRFLKSMNKE